MGICALHALRKNGVYIDVRKICPSVNNELWPCSSSLNELLPCSPSLDELLPCSPSLNVPLYTDCSIYRTAPPGRTGAPSTLPVSSATRALMRATRLSIVSSPLVSPSSVR